MRGSYLHLIKIEMLNAVEYVLYIFFVISTHLSVVDQEFQQEMLVECEKKKKRFFFSWCYCIVNVHDCFIIYLFIFFFLGRCFCSMWFITHALHFLFLFIFFFFNFSLDGSNVTSVNCEAAGKVHSFISGNSSQVNKRLFYHFISLLEW